MLTRIVLLSTALLFAAAANADDYGLRRVLGQPSVSAGMVSVEISTKGDPPSVPALETAANWRLQVTASDAAAASVVVTPLSAHYDASLKIVTLQVPVAALGAIDPSSAAWNVVLTLAGQILTAAQREKKDGALAAAKGRDDADLYVAGSLLAGVATKPVWVVDAKLGYADKVSAIPVISSILTTKSANVRMGIYGEFSTNTDAKPPNDRSQIDPDSIRAYTKLFGVVHVGVGPLYGLKWEFQPAGGEFTRENTSSNFVSAGRVRFDLPIMRLHIDFLPTVGGELGTNLNKPAKLFDRPVDLEKYNAIARALGGADANYYIFRPIKQISSDDPYVFSVSASWLARVPFTPEPFTHAEFLPDDSGKITRQKVVSLRQNTRHFVQVNATWSINKLLGIQMQYKYGSLPPLFELVNHQASIGFVFKAKYTGTHSVP